MDITKSTEDIRQTALWADISDIAGNKDGNTANPALDMEIKIHNTDYDITRYDNVIMLGMIDSRNYVGDLGSYIEAAFRMPLGIYLKKVYPYLHNTEVSIIKDIRIKTKGDPSVRIDRYKGIFLKDRNPNLPTHLSASITDMNQAGFIILVLQLMDRSLEVLRTKTTYGSVDRAAATKSNVLNYKIGEFLSSILSAECNKVTIDGKPCVDMVDVEPPDNTERLPALMLPSGTRVLDVPTIVQEESKGVYNSGIGTFIQIYKNKRGIYIYSLYNPDKYKDATEKITFIVPLTGSHSIGKYTYSYKDNLLRVITDPNVNMMSLRETAMMSNGVGIRNTDASAMMTKPVEMTANGPKIRRNQLNTEIAAKDRADGVNYAPVRQGENISSNIFKKMSQVTRGMGSMYTLVWHSADPDLLYPGAPCKILTLGNGSKVIELYGVIHKVDTTTNGESSMLGVSQNKRPTYDVTCAVDIFILDDIINKLGDTPS